MTEDDGEIIQAETKAITVAKEATTFENDFDVSALLNTVGKLDATQKQSDILFAEVSPDDILIRPDGQVYLDWQWYAGRLTSAFPLKWSLIPQGMPKINGNLLIWGFWLIVDGNLMGFAIGEQLRASDRMTYAECCEAAKSNALMRLSKGLGMARSLWHKPFLDDWKKKNAETYVDKGKTLWRRKTAARTVSEEPAPTVATPADASVIVKRMIPNWKGVLVDADEPIGPKISALPQFETLFVSEFKHPEHFRNHIQKHFSVSRAGELTWEQAIALYDHLHNSKHDPRWYPPEEVVVSQSVSGWDETENLRKMYIAKGQELLYTTLHQHIETRLGNISGVRFREVMSKLLDSVGVVFKADSEGDLAEMKVILDKEFPIG